MLPANATAATLVEDSQIYVRVYVPETYLGRIHVGQEVPLRVDTWPGRTFTGVVEHINQIGEYTPRNLQTADERANQVFAMRVGLRGDAARLLKPGMAAYISVPK
jgi:multidrug resistance efflux pump